jgi:hypothetical protein
MRIWHESLIPCLKRQHLIAMWREGLGCYKIITENKKGYRTHPAVIEFEECPEILHEILHKVAAEAKKRGYNFKELPNLITFGGKRKPWQTLEEQKQLLLQKDPDWYSQFNW